MDDSSTLTGSEMGDIKEENELNTCEEKRMTSNATVELSEDRTPTKNPNSIDENFEELCESINHLNKVFNNIAPEQSSTPKCIKTAKNPSVKPKRSKRLAVSKKIESQGFWLNWKRRLSKTIDEIGEKDTATKDVASINANGEIEKEGPNNSKREVQSEPAEQAKRRGRKPGKKLFKDMATKDVASINTNGEIEKEVSNNAEREVQSKPAKQSKRLASIIASGEIGKEGSNNSEREVQSEPAKQAKRRGPKPGKKLFADVVNTTNLPEGWFRKAVTRKSGKSAGQCDVYIFSPEGVKFRSKASIASYLKKKKSDLKLDNFDFSRKLLKYTPAPPENKLLSPKPKVLSTEKTLQTPKKSSRLSDKIASEKRMGQRNAKPSGTRCGKECLCDNN